MADLNAEPIMAEAATKQMGSQQLLCPFDLQVWTLDRMLNFEITDDLDYEGLELQVFDDPAHGPGNGRPAQAAIRRTHPTSTGSPA